MKSLKLARYELKGTYLGVLVCTAVYLAVVIISAILITQTKSTTANLSGIDFTYMIYVFVAGLVYSKVSFNNAMANSASRKAVFCSSVVSGIGTALGITVLTLIINLVSSMLGYTSGTTISSLYPDQTVLSYVWQFVATFAVFAFGRLIASCHYRSNRIVQVLIAAGIPVLLFFFAPIIIIVFPSFGDIAFKVVLFMLGMVNGTENIWISIGAIFGVSALFFGGYWLALRRMQIK